MNDGNLEESDAEAERVTMTTDAGKRGPRDWREGASRTEKSELIREALLRAATEVVGEVGYAGASITLITQRAGVAQGTFYNYFKSRQDILDQLLPDMSVRMLSHVRESAIGGRNFEELEERSFRAFFTFLKETPHFFRVLNEAESFAPVGHKLHFDTVARRYLRFLRQSWRAGEFPAYSEAELEVIVHILMAARSYIALRYTGGKDGMKNIPARVVRTYMKFVLYGLQGRPNYADRADGGARQRGGGKT